MGEFKLAMEINKMEELKEFLEKRIKRCEQELSALSDKDDVETISYHYGELDSYKAVLIHLLLIEEQNKLK